MNEMDLLTRLRAEVPAEVSPRAADRCYAAFAAERHTEPRRAAPAAPRWRPSSARLSLPRLALAAGLAAAAAAGIVVAVPRSPAHGPAPLTVRELAYRAATAALAAPSVAPSQWAYMGVGHSTNCPKGPDTPAARSSGIPYCSITDQPESWQTADGTRGAYYDEHGHLVVRDNPRVGAQIAYASAVKLPADPRALVKYLYGNVSRTDSVSPPGNASELWLGTFYAVVGLLQDYILPPRLAAELFRALPYVHGVQVMQAAGLVGFTWVGFTAESRSVRVPARTQTMMLDPSTYAVTGAATVSASGRILATMEVPAKIPVSGPGVRP